MILIYASVVSASVSFARARVNRLCCYRDSEAVDEKQRNFFHHTVEDNKLIRKLWPI